MSLPRIEERLESWNKLFQTVVDIKEDEVLGKIITTTGGLNDEQKDWFIKHMEEARQDTLDEAVEILESLKDIDIPDTKPICVRTLDFCIEMIKFNTQFGQKNTKSTTR